MPELFRFQQDSVNALSRALQADGSALLVSPTGSGKTAQMLTVASRHVARARAQGGVGRVLVLTHRRKLLGQLIDEDAPEWLPDQPVGRIAGDGRQDERPAIVCATVQSAAARADRLAHYDLVVVDECHHMYDPARGAPAAGDPSTNRGSTAAGRADVPEASDYERVLRALESRGRSVALLGVTATPFRADGEIHPRLAGAHRHVVTFKEALRAHRIVPPRTVEMDYRLADGTRASSWLDAQVASARAGALGPEVGSALKAQRGQDAASLKAFSDQVVQGWLQAGEDRKTLVFADNLTEMRALEAAFADRGIGVRVMHSEQGDAANRTAESDYKENPDVRALVSVGMIGEGFNAKHTGCVVVANGCPTRAGYAQMIGRATRVDGVRSDGIVLDFSAATRVWGRMEEQIELQDRHERLRRHPEGLRGRVELEAVIERPEPGLPLIGFAARDATVFAVEQGNGNLQLWQRRRMSGRDTARQGNKTRFERLGLEGVPADQPQSLAAFRRFVDQELTDNAGWHARARRRDAAGDVPAQTMVGRDYADYRDLLATSARAELAKREESVGRVGCVATPANRAATLVSAARGVVEGGPADAVETVAEAVKERAHALPREGRAETAYLAGVLAGELANGVTGSARTRLRGIHAALAVDQGRQGMRAVERRSSQELRRTCANLGATLENVAATMTQSGAAEVGRAAAVWGARCRAAAEAVKARPPRDPVKTE